MIVLNSDFQNADIVCLELYAEHIFNTIDHLDLTISINNLLTHFRNNTNYHVSIVELAKNNHNINRHVESKYPISLKDLKQSFLNPEPDKKATLYVSFHERIAHDALFLTTLQYSNPNLKEITKIIHDGFNEIFLHNTIPSAGSTEDVIIQANPVIYDNNYSIYTLYLNQIRLKNDQLVVLTGDCSRYVNTTYMPKMNILKDYYSLYPLGGVPNIEIDPDRLNLDWYMG